MPEHSILSAPHLFSSTLPEAWGSVLDALADLDDLGRALTMPRAEREEAARAAATRLYERAPLLVEPVPARFRAAGERSRWFTEAVLLWMRFAETSSAPLIDTLGAAVLHDFPLDLPPGSDGVAKLRAALGPAFGWSEPELAALEREVAHVISNLALKRALAAALAGWLSEGEGLSPAGRVASMQALYGPVPFRPGDVDVVLTSTALFFCIPKRGAELETPDWPARPEAERRTLGAFLGTLHAGNVAETHRFPAFGWFDSAAIDPRLLDRLSAAAGAPRTVTLETLRTMISVLPSGRAEQYLVHDAWGHTWQEALSEFEWEYALLPKVDDPLDAAAGPAFGGPGTPLLASAFFAEGGRTQLDEVVLLQFAAADVRGRVRVATSAAFAEMLADFMEAKLSRARPAEPLPTSSLLPSASVKLDLTLADLRRQVVRWTRPYRTLAVDGAARRALAEGLAAAGLPEAGLDDAVERAGRAMWHALAPAFDETLRAEPDGGEGIRSSVLRRSMLQLLGIAAELERALERAPTGASAEPRWTDPATCIDLCALAAARFYEQDRATCFWHVDQVLRSELPPACARLREALVPPRNRS